ncbi:FecR family protein [Sphingomonas abietis]|uniref:FecR domain-containing protein n=1 Tax=Sphingomonas abietis TaxID=3012344 RepID=A0ABY7NQV7_9SPHN|nr:FecR domain-containing protein [Sphingomonas abietis]WBO22831.1 FecR domain-containing protein [Sphingomonas abietis]
MSNDRWRASPANWAPGMTEGGWFPDGDRLLAEAAQWMERARSGSDADRAAFRLWLSEAPDHVAAMDLVQRAWAMAPDAARLAGARGRTRDAGRARAFGASVGRLMPVGGMALAGVAAALLWFGSIHSATIATGPHERRMVALADGTRAWLAPGSRLAIRTTPLARTVSIQGEVAFDVRHAWRPFVVDAGGVRTVDHGTLFSVSDRQGVSVLLARGSIAVEDAATGALIATPSPGQRIDVHGDHATVSTVDADDALAWRDGRIVARDIPLAEVVSRFASLGAPRIRLAEPELGRLPVSGSYAGDDVEGFLTALATLYPVSWTADGAGYAVRRHR